MSSRVLGANPYGEWVSEDPNGHRFVQTRLGIQSEANVEPLRVCRATDASSAKLALESLSIAPIAKAFKQNWHMAYFVWTTKQGQVTPLTPSPTANSEKFVQQVVQLQAQKGWKQWMQKSADSWGRLKWEHMITHPGLDGVPMGILAGLNARLGKKGYEWGLTHAFASEQRSQWIPWIGNLPAPKDGQKNFHGQASNLSEKDEEVLLWVDPLWAKVVPQIKIRWIKWWEDRGQGFIVFKQPPHGEWIELGKRLLAQKKPWQRFLIETQTKPSEKYEVWHVGQEGQGTLQKIGLLEWAGPSPAMLAPVRENSVEGRSPYEPISHFPPSEAWAPDRLNDAMQEGLSSLKGLTKGVDQFVADFLHQPMERLNDQLSAEQIDAVGLAALRLNEGRAFILADETGFGKGRTLASLMLKGLEEGRTIVVLTERKQLFNDLYRDLTAVAPGRIPTPFLFHGSARLKNQQGDVVVKTLRPKEYQDVLKQHAWPHGADKLIFSTYAQLAKGKTKEKMAWLLERMGKNAWILLDESHNAAGNSQVGEQTDRLIDRASGVVHASATFVRGENNLNAYRRALPWGVHSLPWIRSALAHDPGGLRQVLVEEMARSGALLRREHAPVPPPQSVWIDPTAEQTKALQAFVEMWQKIFIACEAWEKFQSGKTQLAWLKVGAVMARSVREFFLWLKADALLDRVEELKANDRKIVVAVDSTFEAALREALDSKIPNEDEEEESDTLPETDEKGVVAEGEGLGPRWKDRWVNFLNAVVPLTPDLPPAVENAYQLAFLAIHQLPDWSLSPLDYVTQQAQLRGVNMGEISGRKLGFSQQGNTWKVQARPEIDRTELVAAFNKGEVDALLITRAAASGISLHASRQFEDQRPRTLIEWGVAADPLVRMQFWGRVRRRDQVCEPDFESLAFNQPAERRLRERDERKRRQLSSHLGFTDQSDMDLISPLGESLVHEWAQENPDTARRLGVFRPMANDPTGRADRLLARSLVLPEDQRLALITRLDRGVECASDWQKAKQEPSAMSSRVVRSRWWWGNPDAPSERVQGVWPWRLDWVERSWIPEKNTSSQKAVEILKNAAWQEGQYWLDQWKQVEKGRRSRGFYHQQTLSWAMQHLPNLKKGWAIQLSDPLSQQPTKAMVLGVEGPDLMDPAAWAASQVVVWVLMVGRLEAIRVPLSVLIQDPRFKVAQMPAKPHWFDDELPPVKALTVEGNPLAAAAWGRRLGKGWGQVIHDESGEVKTVWRLPPEWDWRSSLNLPRDLIAIEQVFSFWHQYPDEKVEATLPIGQLLHAQPIPGHIILKFKADTYSQVAEEWLDGHTAKMLTPPRQQRDQDGTLWVVRTIAWKFARKWMEQMANRGLMWRVLPQYNTWYENSCREYLTKRNF